MSKKTPMTKLRLSQLLGVSRQLISSRIKAGNTPPLDDVEAWQELLAATGRDASLPAKLRAKIGEQKFRLVKAQADAKEMENKAKAGMMLPIDEVKVLVIDVIGRGFCDHIDQAAQELPPKLAHRDEYQVIAEIRKLKEKVKKSVMEKVGAWAEAMEAKKAAAENN